MSRADELRPSPGARLVAALSSVVAVAVAPGGDPLRYAAFAVLLFALTAVFRLKPIPLLRRFILLVPLLLVLVAAAMIAGGRTGEAGGSEAAAVDLSVKTFLCFLAAAVTAGTLGPIRLLQGFQELRLPATAAGVLSSGMRFLSLLGEEGTRMRRAREARLTRRERLRHKIAFARGLVPRLFERAFVRSERTYAAMLSRGFDGRLRTLARPVPGSMEEIMLEEVDSGSPTSGLGREDLKGEADGGSQAAGSHTCGSDKAESARSDADQEKAGGWKKRGGEAGAEPQSPTGWDLFTTREAAGRSPAADDLGQDSEGEADRRRLMVDDPGASAAAETNSPALVRSADPGQRQARMNFLFLAALHILLAAIVVWP